MKNIRTTLILLAVIWPATAQVWDNTGNNLLSGQYYFRELTFTSSDAYAAYGTISFSNGAYTTNATAIEAANGEGGAYTPSGTYSIAASGFGFINNSTTSLLSSPIYGMVGANGVFIGSSTESGSYDIFIAAPLTSQGLGTFQGPYSMAYVYPTAALQGSTPYDALLQLNANGAGGIGTVNVTAYATTSTPSSQSISGVNYISSGGAFVLNFPTNSSANLVQGQEYVYSTPDGSFVFGGSPNDFDMLVGVRTGTSGSSFGGLYYTADFQFDESQLGATGQLGLSSSYGSFNTSSGVILGHERIQDGAGAYGYTYADSYPAGSGGSYTDTFLSRQFIGGGGGATQIGVGIGPYPGISVSVQAPPGMSCSGVCLSPVAIENSASYAPFTAGISRGEYITLGGANLGPSQLQIESAVPFPTTLAGVQVLFNGSIPAPIYYVSSNLVAVVVPDEITTSVAQIQVVNNGSASNAVTEFVFNTTPGVFSQQEDGIGYGAIRHQNGKLVTPNNPAQIGETVSVFMSGLGDVFPTLLDGNAAPLKPLSNTSNTITADIDGAAATVSFAGLAPGFVDLYQVNVLIPSGLTSGDNFLDIAGPDSYNSESLIPIGGGAAAVPGPQPHARPHPRGTVHRVPSLNRPARVLPTE